jgi:hypothetical protein
MASKAEEFRKNADDCRQRAERAKNSFDKEHWLEMAEHSLKMAGPKRPQLKRIRISGDVSRLKLAALSSPCSARISCRVRAS